MIFWIWSVAVIAALVLYFRQRYSYFSQYGVKHMPVIPPLGNMTRIMFRMEHFTTDLDRSYNALSGERFYGRYEFLNPVVMVRDLDLVKRVTIKDFDNFLDHRVIISEESDPLFGRNLFSLKGQEWKDMRSTLSPAFTSSKIRVMVPFMVEVGDQMIRLLKKNIKDSGIDYIDVDVKDLTTRYANDVIASCAFGLKVDSQTDPDNQFYAMGKETTSFKFRQMTIFLLYIFFPIAIRKLKLSLFSEHLQRFFRDLVMDTMKDREARHIIRPDMIHLLMEAKKGKLVHEDKSNVDVGAGFSTVEESSIGKHNANRVWSDDDLIAQAILFFVAGFETSSSVMSFLLHELAVNPDVQEKLVQEIRENEAKNGGKFDYSSIQQMTYLDMVVSEVLRLWPPAIVLDRYSNRDYNLGKPNDETTQNFFIRKGQALHIPVWAIHRDPKFFLNPLKFDPERFSDENKHNIKPFTYMPFGMGPRNCIGSRFALCKVKVLVYQLLKDIEVSPAAKTQIPARLDPENFNLRIKGGHWARLRIRS